MVGKDTASAAPSFAAIFGGMSTQLVRVKMPFTEISPADRTGDPTLASPSSGAATEAFRESREVRRDQPHRRVSLPIHLVATGVNKSRSPPSH